MQRHEADPELVDLLRRTFPKSDHDMPAVAEALKMRIVRGPQWPALHDQLVALEDLERHLSKAKSALERVQGFRRTSLDFAFDALDRTAAAVQFQLDQEKKRKVRQNGRTDWHAINAMWEICLCWRDRERALPEEQRRKIPKALSPDGIGPFTPFAERVFEICKVEGKPISAHRAFQREMPGWASELINTNFTDKAK